MPTKYFRAILVVSLLVSFSVFAWNGMGRGGGGSPRKDSKQRGVSWPGSYFCEQCQPEASTTAAADSAPADKPPAGCWSYQLTITRNGKDYSAVLDRASHDAKETFPATVTEREGELELLSTGTGSFKAGDLLVTLNRRESEYFLKFKKLESRVKDQSAITCEKHGK